MAWFDAERSPHSFALIGAAMKVHTNLGPGFLEAVYASALRRELRRAQIPYECEVQIPVMYCGEPLDCMYRADLVVGGNIIVELKAVSDLNDIHVAQVLNYLKATGKPLGFLFNFGEGSLRFQRVVLGRGHETF